MIRLAERVHAPTIEISVDHQGKVDVATLLKGFDRVRRELAREVTGSSGIGVGYDHLAIHWANLAALEDGADVRITAVLHEERANRHAVEFTASAAPRCDEAIKTLVHARGWTVVTHTEEGVGS